MKYTLIGIVLAVAFRLGAVFSQGYNGLIEESWIDYTFWWLLVSGIGVDYLRGCQGVRRARAWLCQRLPSARLLCPRASAAR